MKEQNKSNKRVSPDEVGNESNSNNNNENES